MSAREKSQFLALRFCSGRLKGSALKKPARAFHADEGARTLLPGREVKMEIPAKASHPCTPSKGVEPRISHSPKTWPAAHALMTVLVLIEP
jgi:hypothetical protein